MHFINNESGAVTVDWVVLTAGLVGLGLAVSTVVSSGVQDLSTDIDTKLHQHHIINTSFNVAPEVGDLIMVGDGISNHLCNEALVSINDPDPNPVTETCQITEASASYTYAMSDGSQWTKSIIHNGGNGYTTTTRMDGTVETTGLESGWETIWTDGEGNVVEDPEG